MKVVEAEKYGWTPPKIHANMCSLNMMFGLFYVVYIIMRYHNGGYIRFERFPTHYMKAISVIRGRQNYTNDTSTVPWVEKHT